MLKKIVLTLFIVCGVSLVGAAACIPFGIRGTLREVQKLVDEYSVGEQRIDIDSSIDTIELHRNYGDIIVEQSPDDTAYLTLYNQGVYQYVTFDVRYSDDNKAVITQERVYGNKRFDEDTIRKTLVKEFQNYPDAVLYIPKRIKIETEDWYLFDTGRVDFANKKELLQQIDEEYFD